MENFMLRNYTKLLLFSVVTVLFLSSKVTRRHHIQRFQTNNNTDTSAFIPCLIDNADPNHPIATAIFTPADSLYSSVLQAYVRNARFNTSETPKPFLVITALHVSHIKATVVCAARQNLHMRIRSGGHDFEGGSYAAAAGTAEPFFVLDTCHLRSVHVDIATESAWVEAGATLGELYYRIAEKSRLHGFPGGVCPTVGVGGHVSGGGYGNMMRKYGLTSDNVDDAVVVDVRGRVLDRRAMGEDLFWAVLGGGGSSFAVVVSYKIKLVRVPETVSVFSVTKTTGQNASFVGSRWQQIADKLDEDLFIRFIMHTENNSARATFVGLFLGGGERLLAVVGESFPELGLTISEITETSWAKSVFFWANIDVNTAEEELLSRSNTAAIRRQKRKSDYLKKPISKRGLDSIWEKMIGIGAPVNLTFNPYGGKMARIPTTATAFPHRAGNLAKVQYAVSWDEEGAEAAEFYIGATRQLYEFMTPYVSENPRLAYYNYKDLDLGINNNNNYSYGVKYFFGNFNKLVEIKTRVDPGNFFRNEHSIPVYSTCLTIWSFSICY